MSNRLAAIFIININIIIIIHDAVKSLVMEEFCLLVFKVPDYSFAVKIVCSPKSKQ